MAELGTEGPDASGVQLFVPADGPALRAAPPLNTALEVMSAAAKEMSNPPAALGRAKAALGAQVGSGIAYVIVAVSTNEYSPGAGALCFLIWGMHFAACFFVGLAAKQMGRKWWRYMSWQAGIPLGGPLMSLMYLEHYRDSRS